jgi:hypothetical protein
MEGNANVFTIFAGQSCLENTYYTILAHRKRRIDDADFSSGLRNLLRSSIEHFCYIANCE